MKRKCSFQMNPAFALGAAVNFFGLLFRHLAEPTGALECFFNWAQGAAAGLLLVGLLYGSPKTRPLFHRFHAFKLRLPR